jgi:membrane associated rhomboid family serine protease
MIPIRDLLPTLRFPTVTLLIILANIAVFLGGFGTTHQGRVLNAEAWAYEYGTIPCELFDKCANQRAQVHVQAGNPDAAGAAFGEDGSTRRVAVPEVAPWLTLLTSAFVHGGLLHIAGNLRFFWVFGNNVEDALGRLAFLAFYAVAAVVSGLAQALVDTGSSVPQIGASGAIAATIGAYLLLYPRVRVVTWVVPPLPFFVQLPAWVVAGLWGAIQVSSAQQQITTVHPGGDNVAYMAHVAGFALGVASIRFLTRPTPNYAELYGTDRPLLGPPPQRADGRLRPSAKPHARPQVVTPSTTGHHGPITRW